MMKSNQILILSKITHQLTKLNHPHPLYWSKQILQHTEDLNIINEWLKRIEKQEPIEYILGEAIFKNLTFKVTPSTLIPRIETEDLVDLVLKESQKLGIKNIIDVGTGSGAIAISLKFSNPLLCVTATDISEDALVIARQNALNNKTDIKFIQTDLISDVKIEKPTIIVANLPYIPTNDYLNLDKSVKDFEPKLALDGGREGLDYINRLIEQSITNKNIKTIFLEIDPPQAEILSHKYDTIHSESFKDTNELVRFFKFNF